MSRYEAMPDVADYQVWDNVRGYVWLDDVTEAEAKIIAWALNQVADGMALQAAEGLYVRRYDGPVDGVAPAQEVAP